MKFLVAFLAVLAVGSVSAAPATDLGRSVEKATNALADAHKSLQLEATKFIVPNFLNDLRSLDVVLDNVVAALDQFNEKNNSVAARAKVFHEVVNAVEALDAVFNAVNAAVAALLSFTDDALANAAAPGDLADLIKVN